MSALPEMIGRLDAVGSARLDDRAGEVDQGRARSRPGRRRSDSPRRAPPRRSGPGDTCGRDRRAGVWSIDQKSTWPPLRNRISPRTRLIDACEAQTATPRRSPSAAATSMSWSGANTPTRLPDSAASTASVIRIVDLAPPPAAHQGDATMVTDQFERLDLRWMQRGLWQDDGAAGQVGVPSIMPPGITVREPANEQGACPGNSTCLHPRSNLEGPPRLTPEPRKA